MCVTCVALYCGRPLHVDEAYPEPALASRAVTEPLLAKESSPPGLPCQGGEGAGGLSGIWAEEKNAGPLPKARPARRKEMGGSTLLIYKTKQE